MNNLIEKLKQDYENNKNQIKTINDTQAIQRLFAIFGVKIYDDINDNLKLEPNILKIIFKNYEDKSIEIYAQLDINTQLEYIQKYPKIYSKLDKKIQNNPQIIEQLINTKHIYLLGDEIKEVNYQKISDLILKDINVLSHSKPHQSIDFIKNVLLKKYPINKIIKQLDNTHQLKKLYSLVGNDIIDILNYDIDKLAIHLSKNKTLLEYIDKSLISANLVKKVIDINPTQKHIDDLIEFAKKNDESLENTELNIYKANAILNSYDDIEKQNITNELIFAKLYNTLSYDFAKQSNKVEELTQFAYIILMIKFLKEQNIKKFDFDMLYSTYVNFIKNSVERVVMQNKIITFTDFYTNSIILKYKRFLNSNGNINELTKSEKKKINDRFKNKKVFCEYLKDTLQYTTLVLKDTTNIDDVKTCIKNTIDKIVDFDIVGFKKDMYIIYDDFEKRTMSVEYNKISKIFMDDSTILMNFLNKY